MEFTPDDGHIHQYLNGECTWCGAPPDSDAPPGVTEAAPDGERLAEAAVMALPEPTGDAPWATEAGSGGTALVTHEKFMVAVLTDEAIKGFAAEATRVLEWAKTLTITDNTSAKAVAGDLRSIAILKRNVEARKKELLAPLSDTLKQMKTDIATIEAPLAEADKIGRMKVTDWDAIQRQIQRDAEEATRKIAEAAELARKVTDAGGEAVDMSAVEPVEIPADPGPLRPDGGGTVSMVDHWSAEVTDKTLVPLEYMEPNMQMLNLLARQSKGKGSIPGIKWVNNPTPSVR